MSPAGICCPSRLVSIQKATALKKQEGPAFRKGAGVREGENELLSNCCQLPQDLLNTAYM